VLKPVGGGADNAQPLPGLSLFLLPD